MSLRDLPDVNKKLRLNAALASMTRERLQVMSKLWEPFEATLWKIQEATSPGLRVVTVIAERDEPLLAEANKAIWLYEKVN